MFKSLWVAWLPCNNATFSLRSLINWLMPLVFDSFLSQIMVSISFIDGTKQCTNYGSGAFDWSYKLINYSISESFLPSFFFKLVLNVSKSDQETYSYFNSSQSYVTILPLKSWTRLSTKSCLSGSTVTLLIDLLRAWLNAFSVKNYMIFVCFLSLSTSFWSVWIKPAFQDSRLLSGAVKFC